MPRTTPSTPSGVADLPRVFIDADVLVAGSASRSGAAHLVLQLCELGVIQGVSSAQARREAERVLRRKLPAALPAFGLIADAACSWVDDPSPAAVERHDGEAHPKDLPILVAALESGCDVLLTFNKRDFHPARGAIRIQTPGEFVTRLRALLAALGEQE